MELERSLWHQQLRQQSHRENRGDVGSDFERIPRDSFAAFTDSSIMQPIADSSRATRTQ